MCTHTCITPTYYYVNGGTTSEQELGIGLQPSLPLYMRSAQLDLYGDSEVLTIPRQRLPLSRGQQILYVCVDYSTTLIMCTLLTLGTCAEGLRYSVCLCVCVCVQSLHAAKDVYTTRWIYQLALH